uniref:RIMS-binding protein 2 n=1 Tax=Takifugu rubripes TaxID=31033 RepID=H2TV60_TAKRU
MREAAERRQQLELEHEQALAVLNAKQQEIDLLQKAQVEAKKEHEGAVHLLEAKVRELEEKCRTQSEQFNLLSKELEKFRLHAGKFDILSTEPLTVCESPGSPNKSLSQLLNGLAAPTGKGNEAPMSRSLISEFIRPLQISGDKPELLSVKPTFLTRSRAGSPARAFLSEMDKNLSSSTRSKPRFTGKVRLCVARYSYNPYDGPNEHPEAELPLVAGKYLYVYGTMDEDGFYEGELLDGQRGLVPSNFVDFVQDEEKPSVQQRDTSLGMDLLGSTSNGTGTLDVNIDEVGEDIVPYPRRINLIKQLAKSVIIGWDPPVVPPGWGSISGYHVLVDSEIRMIVPYGGRTKSLIEKLNLATNTYRISVQSITDRGLSDKLRCTMLVGKDVVVAPYYLRVDSITQSSAELSWMPSNSNYSHTIFLNGAEYDMIKAGGYNYKFLNLKPMTVYKVKVVASPHQVPWQLPMDQRDKREISVEFCTQPSGPPLPPQEVQVQCGQSPGFLQVRWKPPLLTSSGTSNGASVIGYAVCTKGQKIAEVLYPTADCVTVEINRIQCLEAREVIVRTLSTQGESQDSSVAFIPHNLIASSQPHFLRHSMPKSKPLLSARESETKEHDAGLRSAQPWERCPSPLPPMCGHNLEPPHFTARRSPSPQRILPQPQGVPIPNTIAKAMAREAAQRVFAEGNRAEKRNIFSERGDTLQPLNSDEEEDGYDSPHARRRGASVDEFLRGSELGRQCNGDTEEYHTESSRGSDLSDIMEEDEEELYSEMQLEEGRRRSINSHNTLKVHVPHFQWKGCWHQHRFFTSPLRKRLHSIPEVAEEDLDGVDGMGQHLCSEDRGHPRAPHAQRRLFPSNTNRNYRHLQRQRSSPRFSNSRFCYNPEEWSLGHPDRQNTKSPDSGLDCGSEEEGSLGRGHRGYYIHGSHMRGPVHIIHCEGPVERRALAMGRKRTLMRQCSVEEELSDSPATTAKVVHMGDLRNRDQFWPGREAGSRNYSRDGELIEGRLSKLHRVCYSPHREARAQSMSRDLDHHLIIGNSPSHGSVDHPEHSGRRMGHIGTTRQQRPIPSIGQQGRGRRSLDDYDESEPEELTRVFVALFDYDPMSMSPNPDAADEELPFKEGQIIKVFGNKDTDGFYRAEIRDRVGLIPCNMVSEIQTEDDDMMGQLLKQGFLPLNTPVEKLERNRRGVCQYPTSTRRMVALYDYDPRESSPNLDVEAELTFCAGDVIIVFGQIDEDGFYYVSAKCFARLRPVCLSSECFSTRTTAAMLDSSEGKGKWLLSSGRLILCVHNGDCGDESGSNV